MESPKQFVITKFHFNSGSCVMWSLIMLAIRLSDIFGKGLSTVQKVIYRYGIHPDIVIIWIMWSVFLMSQSDHIKRLPLLNRQIQQKPLNVITLNVIRLLLLSVFKSPITTYYHLTLYSIQAIYHLLLSFVQCNQIWPN